MDGLWCSFNDCHMIELAQYTAEKAELTREELDRFSADSHRKAAAAHAPSAASRRRSSRSRSRSARATRSWSRKDEAIRPDTTAEGLAKLAGGDAATRAA